MQEILFFTIVSSILSRKMLFFLAFEFLNNRSYIHNPQKTVASNFLRPLFISQGKNQVSHYLYCLTKTTKNVKERFVIISQHCDEKLLN